MGDGHICFQIATIAAKHVFLNIKSQQGGGAGAAAGAISRPIRPSACSQLGLLMGGGWEEVFSEV